MSPEQIKELINASLTSAFTSMCMFGRSISTFSALHSSSTFPSSITSSAWVLDFGASMTAIGQNLTHTKPYDGNEHIAAANDHHLPTLGLWNSPLHNNVLLNFPMFILFQISLQTVFQLANWLIVDT